MGGGQHGMDLLNFLVHATGGSSDLALEAALAKCRRLIVWCATYNYPSPTPSSSPSSLTTGSPKAAATPRHSGSTTVLAYSTILDALLSKVAENLSLLKFFLLQSVLARKVN